MRILSIASANIDIKMIRMLKLEKKKKDGDENEELHNERTLTDNWN